MRFLVALVAVALAAAPAQAQVSGAVVIGGGPVGGVVVFGDGPRWVAPDYYGPARVIVVNDWRGPRGRGHGWWRHRGFREVLVYTDGRRYYDRWVDGRGFRKVVLIERGGRYYDRRWFDDRDYWRDYDRHWRYDGWDDRRWDDRRWKDRRRDDRRDRWDDRRDDRRDDRGRRRGRDD
jgi:hypothetical protein